MAGYAVIVVLPPLVQVVEALTVVTLYLKMDSRLEEGMKMVF